MYRKLKVDSHGYVYAKLTEQEFNELAHLNPSADFSHPFKGAELLLNKLGYFPGPSDHWHWPSGSYTPTTALTTRELHKLLKPRRWR